VLQSKTDLESTDSSEEFGTKSPEPVTTVRSSKRRNNRRREKKVEGVEPTSLPHRMTNKIEVINTITLNSVFFAGC